ncbi:glycosyltransferase [Citrobacter meridianamericanus]|uniref:glycosyltransferase n=1 Tax=Citrobacter meridianamericanus TaxID=2894201 RepID=UPI00351CF6C4
MKLLIIGTQKNSLEDVKCYSDMWMYHLCSAFQSLGVELVFHRAYAPDEDPVAFADSVISLVKITTPAAILSPGVRDFTRIPLTIGERLRNFAGVPVTQIYDGSLLDSAPVDITFTVRDDTWKFQDNKPRLFRHQRYNKYVGWAADSSLFYPEKKQHEQLRIFIDHAAFDVSGFDHSLTIMMNLRQLSAMGVSFVARTLTDEGIADVDPENICLKPYRRNGVSAIEFAAELRQADIFIVTHPESLGLTVLEAAMCGALVLTPDHCIAPDRLQLVNHQVITSKIDWAKALVAVDREANAERVAGFTWEAVARNIISTLNK